MVGETRPRKQTKRQLAQEMAARQRFQRERPGPDQLAASGEYQEAVTLGDYLELVHLAAELRSARRRAGLSLAEVSKRSGLDRAAISRLENGVRDNPTLATLGRYAHALGLRILVSLAPNAAAAEDARNG